MELANESVLTRNPLASLLYSQEKIENTAKPGSDHILYPANDWRELLFKNYSTNQRANLSVSGGGNVARYYVSGAYSKDDGILNVDKRNNFNNNVDYVNYSLRSNVNVKLTKTTEMAVRLSGNFDTYKGPLNEGSDVYKSIVHSNPVLYPAYYPLEVYEGHDYIKHILFGNYDNGRYSNPYADMVKGYKEQTHSQLLAQFEVKQDLKFLTQGLSIRAVFNISRGASFDLTRSYKPYFYELNSYDPETKKYDLTLVQKGEDFLSFYPGSKSMDAIMSSETMINYGRTFGKHGVSGLLVLQTRESLNPNESNLQASLPSRNLGLSGRFTYSFSNRYFAEINFGYNGSERFSGDHRFGFFPSAGVAWMISNEAFWESLKPIVNNLKLRYSYGFVGNDRIGGSGARFFYLSEINPRDNAKSAVFGTEMNNSLGAGWSVKRYANPAVTWERSTKQNYAIEIGLWNKLSIVAEYFSEYRDQILMAREDITSTMGLNGLANPISSNVGEASSGGFDMSVNYNQSWNKDFWTSARFNFTYATSRYEVYEEPLYEDQPWRSRVGQKINQRFGYIAERLFMDDAEARNSPPQSFGSLYGGGDIKYTDINRDGKITAADQAPIGHPDAPEIVYGFGVSTGYKGLDVSFFFQGATRQSFWIDATKTAPFQAQTHLLKAYADNHWSEEKQNMYALWPRLDPLLNANNTQLNTWFMRDGTFLRLKQVEIGYTFNRAKWQQMLHIDNLRLYLSGSNLFSVSRFKTWDVEMAGNGLGYPVQRVFNIGLNMSFN
jgi:TonB-linked SusC/RagA family outer membrane protein